ncbi:MAG: hypothetical protein C0594_00855 [Marinilabiliales bacterium]|nr:MAG: hypothetical protein C0594_00855 [Marinilabiliales bacterium]
MKISTYFFLILIFGLTGCKKYEDGPWISLTSKEKRIVGEWTTNKNEIELTWKLKENKDFIENAYKSEEEFYYSRNGKWDFDNNKEMLLINAIFSRTSDFYYFDENGNEIEYNDNGTLQIMQPEFQYKIYRLTKDELWIGNSTEAVYKYKKNKNH